MVHASSAAAFAGTVAALMVTGSFGFGSSLPLLGPLVDDSPVADRLADAMAGLDATDRIGIIVMTATDGATGADRARAFGIETGWEYSIIDGFSALATVGGIERLAKEPWVEGIWDSRPVGVAMDNSAKDIGADRVWASGQTGQGVTVAVLDTGIDRLDTAFSGAIVACVAPTFGLMVPECSDSDGHGTHVAGTVASRDPTYRGIAPRANLAAVRVLHVGGVGNSGDIIGGMDWVRQNKGAVSPPIRVATMSIGFLNPGCGDGTGPEARAADALVASGVTFTVAAGNSGHATCTVDGASAAFDVITVGAVDDRNTPDPADDTLATFSSGGPTRDGRIKPEVVAPGVNIWSVYLGPTIAQLSGTSMATPHVAGVAALMVAQDTSLDPAQVKENITKTAFAPDAAPDLPDDAWGYGLVDACAAVGLPEC